MITKGQTFGFLLRDFRIPSSGVEVVTSNSDNRQAENRYPTSSHGSFLLVGLLLACELGIFNKEILLTRERIEVLVFVVGELERLEVHSLAGP